MTTHGSTLPDRAQRRAERLDRLTRTGPDTDMGKLLRQFWQPVAVARELASGTAQPLRLLSEDLTLYRSESGQAYLVGGRCAHRGTVLHTGWVEGEQIRCMYHGWRFDGTGQCTQRPAERDAGLPNVRITAYPVHEYCGLIFAYLGAGTAPAFDLPRKDVFERPGALFFTRKQIWNANWLQLVENSLDAVHVSFVHAHGYSGNFIESVTQSIPELEFFETDAGIRQIATRGTGNVRISDWTFPNNNHIVVPGVEKSDPWIDLGVWNVPLDDEHVARMVCMSVAATTPEADERIRAFHEENGDYNPADDHDALFGKHEYPAGLGLNLTSAQDYVAQRGQGVVADRAHETLGRSDAGIALLRHIYQREMDAMCAGKPTKIWRRLEHTPELPIPAHAAV